MGREVGEVGVGGNCYLRLYFTYYARSIFKNMSSVLYSFICCICGTFLKTLCDCKNGSDAVTNILKAR